jgi:hypothetical protein
MLAACTLLYLAATRASDGDVHVHDTRAGVFIVHSAIVPTIQFSKRLNIEGRGVRRSIWPASC